MGDNMSISKIIEELIEISKNKYRFLQIILGIEKNINKSIELDMGQNIVKQIELKDKYTNEVDKLDVKFYNLFNGLKSKFDVDTIDKIDVKRYPQLTELKKIVGEILNVTAEIKIIDNQNTEILRSNMGEKSNRLKVIKQGKKAANAYCAYKKPKEQKKYE